jgi:hypothetical protein
MTASALPVPVELATTAPAAAEERNVRLVILSPDRQKPNRSDTFHITRLRLQDDGHFCFAILRVTIKV